MSTGTDPAASGDGPGGVARGLGRWLAASGDGPGGDARGLGRWLAAAGGPRQVVCIGDSTSRTVDGELTWVDHLAIGLGAPGEPKPAEGFRGIWRTREWTRQGTWRRTTRDDPFDAAPFGFGYVSSGAPGDQLTWTRPLGTPVAAVDVCTMVAPGLGRPQYRVDRGAWREVDAPTTPDAALVATRVDQPVLEQVQVRAGDGSRPVSVAVAGLDIHATDPHGPPRTRLHHFGIGVQQLSTFCRTSEGEPLALLHHIRPELVIVAVTNDVLWGAPTMWEATLRELLTSIEPYADVLLISWFEQRAPRRVDDASTSAGSDRLTSKAAAFVASDATVVVRGTNIPADPETTVVSVESACEVVLSAPATGTSVGGELLIGQGREVAMQAAYRAVTRRVAASVGCRYLDVYDAWSAMGATGWDAATAQGLVLDRNHATAEGHRDIAGRVLEVMARRPDPPDQVPTEDLGPERGFGPLPEIVPGQASVTAPTSGTVELLVPVTLSAPSDRPVTVRWRTRLVEEADLHQAPRSDYVASSGSLTFRVGQTSATVPITVLGSSTGRDEAVLVSFAEPTNAVIGGYWGLGVGVIEPPPGAEDRPVTGRTVADRSEGSAAPPSTS